MKQRLFIFIVLILLVVVLAVLNAATYVQKEKDPDTELDPNRSSYNAGATGTKAFYALLYETGRRVTRWQTSLETINSETRNRPAVFVVIGPLRRPFDESEETQLMRWVSTGGTLVLIDRNPSSALAMSTTQWQMSVDSKEGPDLFSVDSTDQKQMTADTPAQKPVQPAYFAAGVNAVQPSRFASSITLTRYADHTVTSNSTRGLGTGGATPSPTPLPTPYDLYDDEASPQPQPPRSSQEADAVEEDETAEDEATVPGFEAPIVHLAGSDRNTLVEAPFGAGRIIVLTDPYIIANNGINLVDNSRLGINLVTSRDGLIAFDEYHHGYGGNNNRFFQYFEGTPVIALFMQIGLLAALLLFSQSRRFARPIPEREPSRLSKLEYVSAMAELQQRTRAYDLAIENIYSDFRRRATSLLGLDNLTTSRRDLATRIAERTGRDAREVGKLLFECEDVIRGEPIRRRDTVELVERIRELESQLGLKRARRGN